MLIAMWFSQNQVNNYMKRSRYVKNLHKLSEDVKQTLEISNEIIPKVVGMFKHSKSTFILGKGTGEAIAREGALKLKEIGYIHAEGYSASALKHGPFALLEKDFPVIIIAYDDEYFEKCMNAYEEIKARGAKVVVITNSREKIHTFEGDFLIRIPSSTQTTIDILATIPLQLLAYHLSISKGINPDFPRNLAKVVTVE
jgi:glucosamine--fructose-6-phosphate aminotransferase (isomerizing)